MSIAENLQTVRGRIADAAERSGRDADQIILVAVSKTWPAEIVGKAVEAGQTVFGENKVQEGIEKIPVLPANLDWHLIGHLQKNKVRKAITLFSWIETIDSVALAERVDRIAVDEGVRPKVLLQVNIGDRVLFSSYAGETFKIDDRELLLMREDDILAVIEN